MLYYCGKSGIKGALLFCFILFFQKREGALAAAAKKRQREELDSYTRLAISLSRLFIHRRQEREIRRRR